MSDWTIFRGEGEPHDRLFEEGVLPEAPPWRRFQARGQRRGATYRPSARAVWMVNAALYLRRPLLITGSPGSGKSSLADAVARELKLGPVLHWRINSRSVREEGLYAYDALGRLRETSRRQAAGDAGEEDIGKYLRLGPLGTALYPHADGKPRVLLIDEIDKSDIDLPNDLLHVLEEGRFEIPELARLDRPQVQVRQHESAQSSELLTIHEGVVQCERFPVVILTSNGEREMPPAFYRRCLRLELEDAPKPLLEKIVAAHLAELSAEEQAGMNQVIDDFIQLRQGRTLANDQLLNTLYLLAKGRFAEADERQQVYDILMRDLGGA